MNTKIMRKLERFDDFLGRHERIIIPAIIILGIAGIVVIIVTG